MRLPNHLTVLLPLLFVACASGCGQESKDSSTTSVKSEQPVQEASSDSTRVETESWAGEAGDWRVQIRMTSRTINGNRYEEGLTSTNKPQCFDKGTIAGTTSNTGSVTWASDTQGAGDFVITGVRSGDSASGTFEFRGDKNCGVRIPVALTRLKTVKSDKDS